MYIRPRKLIDYLDIVWRRKNIILMVMLVTLTSSFIVIKRIPKIYESTATVIISKIDLPEELTGAPSYESVLGQMKSRKNFSDLITRYSLYPRNVKLDNGVKQLERDITMVQEVPSYSHDKPTSLKISFRYSEPEVCRKLLGNLISYFDDANKTVSRMAVVESNRITNEIGQIQERLKIVAPRTDLAMIQTGISNQLNTISQISASERQAMTTQIQELRNKEYRLTSQIAEFKRLINDQESIVKAQESSVEFNNPAAAALVVKKTELNALLIQYRGQYTEKNPKVVNTQTQLDQINRELDIMRNAPKSGAIAFSAVSVDLRRMKQELRNAETDLEVTKLDISSKDQRLVGMPMPASMRFEMDPQTLASLSPENKSEYERLIADLNTLSAKRDIMFRLGDIGRSGNPMFKIVEMPVKPDAPVGPNRLYLMTLALGLSLLIVLTIVVFLEIPKLVLLSNERDIAYFLGTPVLAFIPKSVAPWERKRNRCLSWGRRLLCFLAAPGLIFILVKLMTKSEIFIFLIR